jgi:hypothetical protein
MEMAASSLVRGLLLALPHPRNLKHITRSIDTRGFYTTVCDFPFNDHHELSLVFTVSSVHFEGILLCLCTLK